LNLKRISITGPESTGKSWLAEKLAACYQTSWVPEFAREYLIKLGREYRFEDIVEIAKGQLTKEREQEEEVNEKNNGMIFCDTDLLVTRIWSEFKYGRCDPWILEQLRIHRYDLYLLCDIDLPWMEDPLREHPDKRKELFSLYKAGLEAMPVKWAVVSGQGDTRLSNAIDIVNRTFGLDNQVTPVETIGVK